MKGIDVSNWQDRLDISKTNYDFVIIRGGYGNIVAQKDRSLDMHVENAVKAGMKIGIYWFSYAISDDDARKEADVCAAVIEKHKSKISLPVFFDWEYDSEAYCKRLGIIPNKALVTAMTIAFMERIKAHGYQAGFYTNLDYMSRMYDYEAVKAYPLWLAQYEGTAKYPYFVRQTSASGKISGYNGTVDLDVMDAQSAPEPAKETERKVTYHDILPAIAKEYGTTETALEKLNGIKASQTIAVIKVPQKSIDEIAREVIAGKWGFWPLRSSNLKRAGYDPDAVQKRVNELMK